MPGFEVPTSAREVFVDITTQVEAEAARSGTRDGVVVVFVPHTCLLYTSPSPRDGLLSRMPSSA